MPELVYKNMNLHYQDTGEGEPLVLIHGFLEELSMWQDISTFFEKTHRVIRLDLLGHGRTGNLGYIHTMEDQAGLVKFLLDEFNITNATLIGHSMGGYIALAFAELNPEMTKGICLMNSTSRPDSDEKKSNRDRGIQAVKQNFNTFIKVAIPYLFSEGNRDRFSVEIKEVTKKALNMSPQGIIASLEGMKIRKDRLPFLQQKLFPLLMIIGKEDSALDYDDLMEEAATTGAGKIIFDDGHMSYIENKNELIQGLSKWHPIYKP